MNRVEAAVAELIAAIIDSPEYQEFGVQKEALRDHPDLKEQIDLYRQENYKLQSSTPADELFDKLDEFDGRYEEFRKNPLVNSFLSAELDFCRLIQNINQKIVEAVDFE